jgi:uncharacterized protein YigE (DUF2233 family)
LVQRASGLVVLVALLLAGPAAQPAPRPDLYVRVGDDWVGWWSAAAAPAAWNGAATDLSRALTWAGYGPGLDVGLAELSAPGEGRRTRLVVVRLDPRRFRLSLDIALTPDHVLPDWSVARVPVTASFAVNAGQFAGVAPWGWLVMRGRELRPPGRGPLSGAVVIGEDGGVRLIPTSDIPSARAAGGIRFAFQSYPTLLDHGGRVPQALRQPNSGLDLTHRDARLGLGVLDDGRLLFALTRFRGLGGAGEFLPLGLTNPEMAAVMGALGCRSAVALDGGLSAQLLVRRPGGQARTWRGLRAVPLGLVAEPAS